MAGLQFNYDTPIDSPIADKSATGAAVRGGGLSFADPGELFAPAVPVAKKQQAEQGDFRRGLGIAWDQTRQMVPGVKAAVGEMIGSKSMVESGLAEYNKIGGEIAARSKKSDSFTDAWNSEDPVDLIDFVQYGTGYVVGQAGQAVAATILGGGVGGIASLFAKGGLRAGVERAAAGMIEKRVAAGMAEDAAVKSVFRELGAGAALASFNLSQELGQIYPEAVQEAASKGEDVSMLRVVGASVLAAGLDTLVDAANLKGLAKAAGGGKTSDAGLMRRIAQESFAAGLREGGTELAQTGIERWGASQDLSSPEAIKDYVDSTALGILGGGLVGGATGAITRKPTPEAPPAPVASPDPSAQPAQPAAPGATTLPVGSSILVTPELRDKFKDDLEARGVDPASPEADAFIKNWEGVERAAGVIRRRQAEEERAARQAEVEAAFGQTASSGVGVGVGGADTLVQRAGVTPDPETRTLAGDTTQRVSLPPTGWNDESTSTPAVSGEDLVARQQQWEVSRPFEVRNWMGHTGPVANRFVSANQAMSLLTHWAPRTAETQFQIRQAKRSKAEGGGTYYFIEERPLPPGQSAIVGVKDSKGIQPTTQGSLVAAGAAAAPATPGAAPASAPATAPTEKPSRSAGKATGLWKTTPMAPRIQKMIDDLNAAGRTGDAKSVDISSTADFQQGQLNEERVAKREKWARGRLQPSTVEPRGREKVQGLLFEGEPAPASQPKTEPAPAPQAPASQPNPPTPKPKTPRKPKAEPVEEPPAAQWTRMTTADRQAAVARALPDRVVDGELNESGKRMAARGWDSIGEYARGRLERVLRGEDVAPAPAPAQNAPSEASKPAPTANSDVAIVAGVRERIAARTQNPGYLLDVAPEPKPDSDLAAAVEVAQRLFGRQVILVTQGDKQVFDGIFTQEGKILLDAGMKKPALAVLGHELLHSLRREDPELYGRLIERLKTNARDLGVLRGELDKKYDEQKIARLSDDVFMEEFAADVVGDFFTDPKFWGQLSKLDAGLFQKMADFVTQFLDRVYNMLKQADDFRPFRTDQFLNDLSRARKDVASAIQEYAQLRTAKVSIGRGDQLSIAKTNDLFAESLNPRKAGMAMNWIITNPIEARGVLGLPSFTDQRSITKREFGEAVDAWRKGKVERDDYSAAAVRKLADALALEVEWYAGYAKDSGIDWYRGKFQRSIDVLAQSIPSLKNKQDRGLFTLLLAITSDGTEVQDNLNFTVDMYQAFKAGRKLAESTPGQGKYESSYQKNAELVDSLIAEHGLARTLSLLLEPMQVSDVKQEMAMIGAKSPASDYPDDAVLPRAAVYLGPKLGAFYANLMGETGYLTMDRWWNRTINRYRGYMTPSPSESSMEEFRALVERPRLSEEKLLDLARTIAAERQRKYEAARAGGGTYAPTKAETLATTIDKNARTELNDSPINRDDRAFQIKVVKAAQAKLRERGIEAAVADIQATIWYYEKELFASIGVKGRGRISYEEAATRWVRERGRPAARSGGVADQRAEAADAAAGRQEDLFSVAGDRGGRSAGGSLAPLPGAPTVRGASGPDPRVVAVAERYARDNGIPYARQATYVQVDEDRARRIAQAYEQMQHAPRDPAVREAYANLIRQTRAQYDALVADGYSFTFFDSASDPYAGNPWNAMRDLRENQRMAVYGTYDGYGTAGVTKAAIDNNPMLADTGLRWPDQAGVMRRVLANDLFRAVHDAFGHGIEGAGFRAQGEENAWQAHARLFTGSAVGAITTETRGQNSWLNYGPYGEKNRTAAVEDTVFADQKTGLLPEWTWTEGRVEDMLSVAGDTVKARGSVNSRRLAEMLGPQLYGDMKQFPKVAVKEMLQNAFDAVKGQQATNPGRGNIAIAIDTNQRRITVADTGTGMSTQLLTGPFLQIAGTDKTTGRAAGGFGIAKMQFLYGSEALEVYTMKDGVLSVLKTTGAALMNSVESADAAIDVQVYRGAEAQRLYAEQAKAAWDATGEYSSYKPTDFTHGTVVTVVPPASFEDTSTGEQVEVKIPDSIYEYEVLRRSPLFEDIKVSVGTNGSLGYHDMGNDFSADDWTQLFDVKFAWGTANVYASRKVEQYMWGENADLLSNGLWQFSSTLKSGDDTLPRKFIINIEPAVKAGKAGYPFQFNRQGLTPQAQKDFGVVAQYLAMLYQRDTLGDSVKEMAAVSYLNRDGSREQVKGLTAPKLQRGIEVDQKDKVEIKDGKLVVNGRTVPVLSADDMKAEKVSVSEYKVPDGTVDPNRPVFHNNLMLPKDIERYASENKQWGYDKAAETKDLEYVSLEDFARDRFGKRFDTMNWAFADAFRRLRDLVVDVYDGEPGAEQWVANAKSSVLGVGYDQNYRGVNAVLPFRQMLINPAATVRTDPQRGSMGMYVTMVHEIAHEKVRSHGVQFEAQMQLMLGDLMFDQDADLIRRDLRATFESHQDVIETLNKVVIYAAQSGIGRAVGRNLQTDNDLKSRDALTEGGGRDARDDGGAGRVGERAAGVAGRDQGGPVAPVNELDDGGVRGEDRFSLRADPISRPGWDERTTRALNEPFTPPAGKTIKDRLQALRPDFLRRFTAAVADPFVGLKSLDDRLYMRARLTNGTDGGLEALMQHGQVYNDGGALNVRAGTKGLIEALTPLGAEVEDFFRWVALNRASELKKQDRENFFTDESIALRGKLVEGNMPDGRSRSVVYRQALADMNALNRSVLQLARENGLLDQAGLDRFSKDIWYVPFYRIAEENEGDVTAYYAASGLSNQAFGERLKGGTDQVAGLLPNLLRNWGGLLAASQKNGVARDVLEQAKGMMAAQEVRPDTAGAIKVMVDGKRKAYQVTDPLVADALLAINTVQLNHPILKTMAAFKRWLTGAVTIDPAFKIRNLMRDSIQSISLAELPFNPIANVARGMRDLQGQTKASALAGGGLFHGHLIGEDDIAKRIDRLVSRGIDRNTVLTDPKQAIKAAWDMYGKVGDDLENANRMALYSTLIGKGKSHLEAAFAARDLMDFSLQGQSTAVRMLAMTLPFFNARLQGLYKLGRDGVVPTILTVMGKADEGQRIKAARFATVAGAVTLASLLLYLSNKDDEDFQKREPWDRDNFWWFKVGDIAYRIPKPFELGSIATIAERGLEQMIDDNAEGKVFTRAITDMLKNTFAFDPVPQMFRPALSLVANKDPFTGRSIETFGMEQLSKTERYGLGTSSLAKGLSEANQALADLAGPIGKGMVLSPVQIDYLARGYFGWLGATIFQSSNILTRWGSDVEYPSAKADDYPVVGSFVDELPAAQSRYVQEFYDSAEKVQQQWQDIKFYQKLGQFDKARELIAERPNAQALNQLYTGAQRQIAQLNTQMKRIELDEKMSGDIKREKLDELSQRKSELARRVELMRRQREDA